MRLLVIGATGRTGAGAIDAALAAGHDVTALVRNPAGYAAPERVTVAQGDVYAPATLDAAFAPGFDAVIVTVGANVFKPSTLVTDSARAVVAAARKAGVARYLGITGIAQLPATLPGKVAQFALRISPIKYAVRDHQGAYDVVAHSELDWTLAACPYIKDGPALGRYRLSPNRFPGGFHIIHPGDVGAFLVAEAGRHQFSRTAVGIWY